MKVFKMNDYDWVCAESEQQAKEFYEKETGFTMYEVNEEFVGEVSPSDTMLTHIDELPIEQQKEPQAIINNG